MNITGTSVIGFCLLVLVQGAAATPQNRQCDLPQGLQREIATKYPGRKLVTLSDLQEDDRAFFQKDHGNSCPGLVKVDFYGDGNGRSIRTSGLEPATGQVPRRLRREDNSCDQTRYCFFQVRGLGHPLRVDRKGCQQDLDRRLSFKYDPLGRRVYKSSPSVTRNS